MSSAEVCGFVSKAENKEKCVEENKEKCVEDLVKECE